MSGVTALKFTRKSGSNIIDTIITTDLPDSDKYITDFESDLSVIFKGTADVDQYLSNGNIPIGIVIEYITDGDPQSLATTSADITESDLDTTLNIDSITTINSSPVMSGDGFTSVLDTTSTKTVYSIMFGDGTPIPELQEIRMKVDSNGWIEFHKGGKQVNIQGKDDTTQTYKFAEFGEDSGKYLFLGRFNNTGDGGYLIYTKKSDAVTGWSFTGSTLAVGLSNILADKAVYDRAFVGIIPTIPTVRCRYVRFAKTEDITNWNDRVINLGEVYVYDSSGINVARGKTVMYDSTTSTDYRQWGSQLVDGDDLTFAHTGDSVKQNNTQPQKQWIQIDLGSEMEISSIKVIDRPGYPTRLDKVKIQLLNASETVVHTSPELTTAAANKGIYHTYTITTQTWEHSTKPVNKCWSTFTGDDCANLDGNYGAGSKGVWRVDPHNPKTPEACTTRQSQMPCGGFKTVWGATEPVNKCWSTFTGDDCANLDGNYGAGSKGVWRVDPHNPKTPEACTTRQSQMPCGGFKTVWSHTKPV